MAKKMNVIIDGRMIDEQLHGIARYTYELIKYGQLSEKVNYFILVNDINLAKRIFNDIKNVNFIKMKSKFLSIKEQFELPKIINNFQGKVIFHSPSFVGSPFIKKDMIMTIHDLNHIRFPKFYSPLHKYYYKYIVKTSAKNSKKILTVSNFSRNELLEWLRCKDEKVKVTYNGIDEKFTKVKDLEEIKKIKEKYNLPQDFILYLGNQKPHKNVITLVKAFNEIKDEKIKLVMNSKPNEEIKGLISQFNLEDKVLFIGFVEDRDLPILYSMAKIFVFPSLYEGFGLPPLEAMSCGTPTIVSNSASLPEVVDDGAVIFNTLDYKDLAKKIDYMIKDKNIHLLVSKGKKRSSNFSWKTCFNETYLVYNEIWKES